MTPTLLRHSLRFLATALGLLAATSVFAAIAPDSLAGRVFHEVQIESATRSSDAQTVILYPDNHYTVLWRARGSAFNVLAGYQLFLSTPAPDSTYTYARTGEATGTLTLADASGSTAFDMTFTSATEGTLPVFFTGSHSFFLSELVSSQTATVANVSVRGRAAPGQVVIAGFVVPGPPPPSPSPFMNPGKREVLIRAVGPSLAGFGVTNGWADPTFRLMRGTESASIAEVIYPDWTAVPFQASANNPVPAFEKVFAFTGAFPLRANSKEAAAVVRLAPGAYTIVCEPPAGDSGGEVLLEVYFLP